MYSDEGKEKYMSAVVRQVEFSDSEILREGYFGDGEDTDEGYEDLVITGSDGGIYIINTFYPIVTYRKENDGALNYAINSIKVGIATGRKTCITYEEKLPHNSCTEETIIEEQAIAFIKTESDDYIEIDDYELTQFLYKKPNLFISPKGVLIFYTPKEIQVTLDCRTGIQIMSSIQFDDAFQVVGAKSVELIYVNDEGVSMIKFNDGIECELPVYIDLKDSVMPVTIGEM